VRLVPGVLCDVCSKVTPLPAPNNLWSSIVLGDLGDGRPLVWVKGESVARGNGNAFANGVQGKSGDFGFSILDFGLKGAAGLGAGQIFDFRFWILD
jgi:hypothetical protein